MSKLIVALKKIIAQNSTVTIDDIKPYINDTNMEVRIKADLLLEYFESKKEEKDKAEDILDVYTQVINHALKIVGDVPYYSKKDLIYNLLNKEEFSENIQDYFPISIHISAKQKNDTIGILVHYNGKKVLFEGNDEASDETLDLVDQILEVGDKEVTVYGSHDKKIVNEIGNTKTLPINLYVSPQKSHAAGYYGENKILFSCSIKLKDVARESEIDWKTKRDTPIKNFKTWN